MLRNCTLQSRAATLQTLQTLQTLLTLLTLLTRQNAARSYVIEHLGTNWGNWAVTNTVIRYGEFLPPSHASLAKVSYRTARCGMRYRNIHSVQNTPSSVPPSLREHGCKGSCRPYRIVVLAVASFASFASSTSSAGRASFFSRRLETMPATGRLEKAAGANEPKRGRRQILRPSTTTGPLAFGRGGRYRSANLLPAWPRELRDDQGEFRKFDMKVARLDCRALSSSLNGDGDLSWTSNQASPSIHNSNGRPAVSRSRSAGSGKAS